MKQTYSVVGYNVATLKDMIAKLNKKAKKLNVPPISLSISDTPTTASTNFLTGHVTQYFEATVKEHAVYNGVKQTVLQRVAVLN